MCIIHWEIGSKNKRKDLNNEINILNIDKELDEKYYIDDIEYWVLLKKPKGETK